MRGTLISRLKRGLLRGLLPGALACAAAAAPALSAPRGQTRRSLAARPQALAPAPAPAPAPASTLTDGLVAHWRLEEASGARNDSKGATLLNDNKGVTQGAGRIGQAARFAAAAGQSLSAADNAELSTGDLDFTGSLWVRFETLGRYQHLMTKGGEYDLYLDGIEGNRLKFLVHYAGGGRAAISGESLSAEVWHHVLFWHDSANDLVGLSVDGGPPLTAQTAGAPADTPGLFRLGDNGWNNYLDGRLDEVSLWKRLLTPAERAALWNGGAGVDLFGGAPPPPGGAQWQYTNSNAHYTAGSVGIGKTSPAAALDVVGGISATGSITGGNIAARYQDLAEWVPASAGLAAGTVVVLDRGRVNHVRASREPYDTAVAGVVSAQPGIALGEGGEGKVLVATTGRVRVRAVAWRAPIRVGDLLVTSGVEGAAMRSAPAAFGRRRLHAPGTIIGKALEPLDKGAGEILVLLSLQ